MEVISIPNFYHVNPLQRIKINHILEHNYKKNYNERMGFNYKIDSNDKFFVNLYDQFLESCKSIFLDFELSPTNSRSCWCYRSKGDDYKPIFHNHATTSTINAVYYYQVEQGDRTRHQKWQHKRKRNNNNNSNSSSNKNNKNRKKNSIKNENNNKTGK